MTLQQEIQSFISVLPDSKLLALRPLLAELADDSIIIETDLTAAEQKEIQECRALYRENPDSFTPLSKLR
jgi:hypothetical protein